jgi:hypothetical protein
MLVCLYATSNDIMKQIEIKALVDCELPEHSCSGYFGPVGEREKPSLWKKAIRAYQHCYNYKQEWIVLLLIVSNVVLWLSFAVYALAK